MKLNFLSHRIWEEFLFHGRKIFNFAYAYLLGKRHRAVLFFLLFVFGLLLVIPPEKPLFPENYSTVIEDKNGEFLRVFLNDNDQWFLPPQTADTIPFKLKKAVVYFEDEYFEYHPGVNPFSLARAAYQNIKSGKIVSGASTLTMQVSRLRNPKNRNYFSKIIEMLDALRLECHYSKEEILHLYLNHAPYGGNIVGYQAASYKYFGKSPRKLTWGEAATLAVLPNAPGLISPSADAQKLEQKRNFLLEKLLKKEVIDSNTCQLSKMENIPRQVIPFEFHAPHLTRKLNHKYGKSRKVIQTTLDIGLQQVVSDLTKDHLHYLEQLGITNGAVLVAETKTGKVRSYIGSKDFFERRSEGQVDGVTSPRSSGSLLKPFLYALSMDEGIILPKTLMKDVPTYFDAFSPSNASEKFMGVVRAEKALTKSLNVPAVRLLNTYGLYQFYSFLETAGLSTLFRSADDYGLPLIIGGAEVTLWDMAAMFRGLGQYGKFSDLQVVQKSEKIQEGSPSTLISPGACYLTLEILKDLQRPGVELFWEHYSTQKPIAWKTGTSYGHKDAWAVGVSPQWTIAVWVGNFSGEGNVNLSGTQSAGPLLFKILNHLPHDSEMKWFQKPYDDLIKVEMCKETGFLAGPNCENTQYVDAPLNMKPLKMCPYHKKIFVDEKEEYRVCSKCWEEGHHAKKILQFPPRIASFLRSRGQVITKLPPHKPSCPATHKETTIQIIYPEPNGKIWVPRDFKGKKQKLILRAAHIKEQATLFWYLDDKYLGKTVDQHSRAVDITPGWHRLSVIDKSGNRDEIKFYTQAKEQ